MSAVAENFVRLVAVSCSEQKAVSRGDSANSVTNKKENLSSPVVN